MIQIYLLRVSTDSQYLEFKVGCPTDYRFNKLYITRYNVLTKQNDVTLDASNLLSRTSNEEVIRLSTSALGTEVTMYQVEFGVESIGIGLPEIESVVGTCSNINFIYAYLLDLIINFTDCCISPSDYDLLDRGHMLLYAHQEAMRLERYVEATTFYDILWKLYSKCAAGPRQSNMNNNPCNCT